MDSRSPSTMFLFSLLALQTPIQAPHKYWGFSTLQMHYFTFFFFSWYFGQKPLFATQHLTKTHLINCKKKINWCKQRGKKYCGDFSPFATLTACNATLHPNATNVSSSVPPPKNHWKGENCHYLLSKWSWRKFLLPPPPKLQVPAGAANTSRENLGGICNRHRICKKTGWKSPGMGARKSLMHQCPPPPSPLFLLFAYIFKSNEKYIKYIYVTKAPVAGGSREAKGDLLPLREDVITYRHALYVCI